MLRWRAVKLLEAKIEVRETFVRARAGHSQGSTTERYMHAAQVLFPGAAVKREERMLGVLPDEGAAAPKRRLASAERESPGR